MENKITINGKTLELDKISPEFRHMLAELGIIPDEKQNVFKRVDFGKLYWSFTRDVNEPVEVLELEDSFDNRAFEHANYFTDKSVAVKLARQFELQRRLLRYAYNNNVYKPLNEIEEGTFCDNNMARVIRYSPVEKDFKIWTVVEPGLSEVTFDSLAAAEEAFEKVVRPFVEAHPEMLED